MGFALGAHAVALLRSLDAEARGDCAHGAGDQRRPQQRDRGRAAMAGSAQRAEGEAHSVAAHDGAGDDADVSEVNWTLDHQLSATTNSHLQDDDGPLPV